MAFWPYRPKWLFFLYPEGPADYSLFFLCKLIGFIFFYWSTLNCWNSLSISVFCSTLLVRFISYCSKFRISSVNLLYSPSTSAVAPTRLIRESNIFVLILSKLSKSRFFWFWLKTSCWFKQLWFSDCSVHFCCYVFKENFRPTLS